MDLGGGLHMLFIQSSWKHTKATGEAGRTFSSGFEGAGEVQGRPMDMSRKRPLSSNLNMLGSFKSDRVLNVIV